MNKRCEESVCGQGRYGAFHLHQCHKKAVVERDGRAFCKIHDPVYKKEKYIKASLKWEQERGKASEEYRLSTAAPDMLAALEKIEKAYQLANKEMVLNMLIPEHKKFHEILQDGIISVESAIAKAKGDK